MSLNDNGTSTCDKECVNRSCAGAGSDTTGEAFLTSALLKENGISTGHKEWAPRTYP
jgi:hypothetical protein